MTHTKRLSALILTVIMILSIIPASAFAAVKDGWHKTDAGKWNYYVDGEMIKDQWYKIGGKWYYFYTSGEMAASSIIPDEKLKCFYIVDASGAMVTTPGWYSIKVTIDIPVTKIWFYIKKNGTTTIGWKKIGGKWYYFFEMGGIMINSDLLPDGLDIEDKLYFFNKDGTIKTNSWIKSSEGAWYYTDKNGAAVTGWKQIGKTWYYFGKSGAMYSDYWLEYPDDSTEYYYFDKSGAMVTNKWVEDYGDWYYQGKDGRSVKGWKQIGGKWYYLDPDDYGCCITDSTKLIDGKWYTFDENGVCVNPGGSDGGVKVA